MPIRYATAIQQVKYPSSPVNGQFFVVGSVPATCLKPDGSKRIFPTEDEALAAILADPWVIGNPAHTIQRSDCSVVERGPVKYQSKRQADLFFWAEADEASGAWCVIQQVTGYPATEAHDDWFANHRDADALAKQLAEES